MTDLEISSTEAYNHAAEVFHYADKLIKDGVFLAPEIAQVIALGAAWQWLGTEMREIEKNAADEAKCCSDE